MTRAWTKPSLITKHQRAKSKEASWEALPASSFCKRDHKQRKNGAPIRDPFWILCQGWFQWVLGCGPDCGRSQSGSGRTVGMLYPGTRIGGWCIDLEFSGMESEKEIRFVFLEINPSRKYLPLWAFLKIHGFSRRKTIWRGRSLLLQTVFIPKPATMPHSPLKRHSRVSSSTWENPPPKKNSYAWGTPSPLGRRVNFHLMKENNSTFLKDLP